VSAGSRTRAEHSLDRLAALLPRLLGLDANALLVVVPTRDPTGSRGPHCTRAP
jgi:hypothetical protein